MSSATFTFPGTPRSSFGHVVDNKKLYIVGGHVGGFHSYPASAFSRECHCVDLPTGAIKECQDYQYGVQGQRLVALNGKIFSFGGFRYDNALDYSFLDRPGHPYDEMNFFARSTSDIYSLDTASLHWSLVGQLPRPRSSYVAGVIENVAYLMGGWDGTPHVPRDHSGVFHRLVDTFSLSSGSCVPSLTRIREPMRRAFTATVHNGSLIVAGGLSRADAQIPEGDYLNNVTAYDPATKMWKDLSPMEFGDYPSASGWFSPGICALPDCLVVFGGLSNTYDLNGNTYVLKDGSSRWIKNTQTASRGAMFPELIWLGDRAVLVLGGHDMNQGGPSASFPLGLAEVITIDR